ncbi:MAG: hypothetical protein DRJ49_01740 [Thermoprotei archaeon]|nr:MAG: hypothetical protein DRN53_01100 [Thermoprotei archaeon]RLE89862.1 MAG: hypothetical protein DRJ49_01740 [Thermoprotei archaeon]
MRSEIVKNYIRELTSSEILELSEDYYERAIAYLSELRSRGEYDKRALEEYEILEDALKFTLLLRLKKIIESILNGEKVMYERLLNYEKDALRGILDSIRRLTEQTEERGRRIPRREHGHILVRFLKRYPKIIASNGRSYGPFKKEDLAYLPAIDVKFLKSKNVVEEFQ